MDTRWIELVMRLNTAIVATDANINDQIAKLSKAIADGQDSTEGEALLTAHGLTLVSLRKIHADLLRDQSVEE